MIAVDATMGEPITSLPQSQAVSHKLDVRSPESIKSFKQNIGDQPVDLLLNVAGTMAALSEDSLESVSLEVLERTFRVNTFGPLLLTQAILPNILASSHPRKTVAIVSSRVGSISDNSSSGSYAYRASKTAVNQIGKCLSLDLAPKGVLVMLLHPGFVRTNLNPSLEMPPESVEPEEAAEKLWTNIVSNDSKIGMEQTGKFWHREGFELDW